MRDKDFSTVILLRLRSSREYNYFGFTPVTSNRACFKDDYKKAGAKFLRKISRRSTRNLMLDPLVKSLWSSDERVSSLHLLSHWIVLESSKLMNIRISTIKLGLSGNVRNTTRSSVLNESTSKSKMKKEEENEKKEEEKRRRRRKQYADRIKRRCSQSIKNTYLYATADRIGSYRFDINIPVYILVYTSTFFNSL